MNKEVSLFIHFRLFLKWKFLITKSRNENMVQKAFTLLFFFLAFQLSLSAQKHSLKDSVLVNSLLESSKSHFNDDTTKVLNFANQALEISKEIKYRKGEAYALKNLGIMYYIQANFDKALEYWDQSLERFEKNKDDVGISNVLNNIAAVYVYQGADALALEYTLRSLQIAEKIKDTFRIVSALTQIGAIHHNKRNPVAINYLVKALDLSEKSGKMDLYVLISGNIGEVYYDLHDNEKALAYFQKSLAASTDESSTAFDYNGIGKIYLRKNEYEKALQSHEKALAISQRANDKSQMLRSLAGIADVNYAQNNYKVAINYYERAKKLGIETEGFVELKDIYQKSALAYSKIKEYDSAFANQINYSIVKDSLYTVEAKKKLNQLQFDFDLAKKQNEIELTEAEVKTQRQAKMAFAIGLGFIALLAFIIYRNYLNKSKTNKILDKQKDEIEGLLLNILPEEVATELKVSGESKPRHFEEVSVLFTDFKGFTLIADKMSPVDLVEELNECFMAFDSIIEKYDLEKIKTIGDAYMCAGNIPSPDPQHSYKIIRAGLDIQDFIVKYNARRKDRGLEAWEIRIGVHIGPVVAGVVGKKKYAYDIWGSTVNIASRMESNGDPGRVNISATTYTTVKEYFECSYRGKIEAKNLGEIDMYFVDYEKQHNPKQISDAAIQSQHL